MRTSNRQNEKQKRREIQMSTHWCYVISRNKLFRCGNTERYQATSTHIFIFICIIHSGMGDGMTHSADQINFSEFCVSGRQYDTVWFPSSPYLQKAQKINVHANGKRIKVRTYFACRQSLCNIKANYVHSIAIDICVNMNWINETILNKFVHKSVIVALIAYLHQCQSVDEVWTHSIHNSFSRTQKILEILKEHITAHTPERGWTKWRIFLSFCG